MKVRFEYTATYYTEVEVDTDDKLQAQIAAEGMLRNGHLEGNWELLETYRPEVVEIFE